MIWLELTRDVRALLWIAVLVACAGSAWRENFSRTRRDLDAIWALFAYVAVAVLGYNARWLFGIAAAPSSELDIATRVGLNILLTMIAVGVLWKRHVREGWRW